MSFTISTLWMWIGIHCIGEENVQAELGITLHTALKGKGYASEALKGIIDFFVMICINIELQVP